MRFLLPLILIGAILGSQAAFAQSANVSGLRVCSSRAQERRALRLIRMHRSPNCQPKSVQSSSLSFMSSSKSSQSSVSSSRSSSASVDPRTDTEIRSQFLLLGEVGPILGAASIFIEEEPVEITSISVNLTQETPTVGALLVYNDRKEFLGTALLDPSTSTNRTYKVSLPSEKLSVDKREERTIYVRPRLMSRDAGGQSNQTVQISSVVIKANGVWSSQPYTKASSSTSGNFPTFVTARSTITSVKRIGELNAALTSGTQKILGAFEFTGRKTDSSAHIDVTTLVFSIEQTGGVSLANVSLGADGFNEKFACTTSSTTVTCASIPDLYGSLGDQPRRLTLYGDITLSDALHAGLRMTLNAAGSPSSDGSVTWSDGSSNFTWLGLSQPIAQGTYYKY